MDALLWLGLWRTLWNSGNNAPCQPTAPTRTEPTREEPRSGYGPKPGLRTPTDRTNAEGTCKKRIASQITDQKPGSEYRRTCTYVEGTCETSRVQDTDQSRVQDTDQSPIQDTDQSRAQDTDQDPALGTSSTQVLPGRRVTGAPEESRNCQVEVSVSFFHVMGTDIPPDANRALP